MKRIYSNYSEEEYELMTIASKEVGLSLSAYQKYCGLLRLSRSNAFLLPDLIQEMFLALKNREKGSPFIGAALLPEKWIFLTRSQKITLSKKLSAEIKANPSVYTQIGALNGNVAQYVKL